MCTLFVGLFVFVRGGSFLFFLAVAVAVLLSWLLMLRVCVFVNSPNHDHTSIGNAEWIWVQNKLQHFFFLATCNRKSTHAQLTCPGYERRTNAGRMKFQNDRCEMLCIGRCVRVHSSEWDRNKAKHERISAAREKKEAVHAPSTTTLDDVNNSNRNNNNKLTYVTSKNVTSTHS